MRNNKNKCKKLNKNKKDRHNSKCNLDKIFKDLLVVLIVV